MTTLIFRSHQKRTGYADCLATLHDAVMAPPVIWT
jgi:hypothetical protein